MKRMSLLFLLLSISCSEKEFLSPEVSETSIEKNRSVEDLSFPFIGDEELDYFTQYPNM